MTALQNIQNELKAPKGQYNSFGKFRYRSCEDILEAVKPLLKKHDATLTLSDSIVNVGDRYYVQATAQFTSDEGSVAVTAFARESDKKSGMDDSQITGTASSYARKYALNGLFLIDDTKDADTDEYKGAEAKADLEKTEEVKAKKIAPTNQKVILQVAESVGVTEVQILKMYGLKKISDMTEEQFRDCSVKLQKQRELLEKKQSESADS